MNQKTLPNKFNLNEFKLENTSVSNFLSILLSVAKTMKNYHKQGCVQLDIKPENILVSPNGQEEYKVEFLGFERYPLAQKDVTENAPLKEQNPTADCFALGIVLFKFIMGRPPRNLECSLAADYQFSKEIKSKFNNDEYLLELVRELFRKTISMHPSIRYQTDDDFIKKLQQLCNECRGSWQKSYKISPKFSPNNSFFIGRDGEVGEIGDKFSKNKNNKSASVIILRGEDGIGKTAIAVEYGKKVQNEGRTVVWLCYQNNFQETFNNDNFLKIENFTWSDFRKSNIVCTTEDYFEEKKKCFVEICKAADDSRKRILMIVDDINEGGFEELLNQLSKYPCDILVTSNTSKQEQSSTIVKATIEVKSLNEGAAKEILTDACRLIPGETFDSLLSEEERNVIEGILKEEKYRIPLLFQILAGLLDKRKKQGDLKKIPDIIFKEAFIRTPHTQEISNEIKEVYISLFRETIKDNPAYVKILSNLCFVPKRGISRADFEEAFSRKPDADVTNLLAAVTDLIEGSWIQCSDETISLHPVVAEVVAAECSEEIQSSAKIVCYVTRESRWYELKSDEENLAWLELIQNCIQVLQPETDVWLTFVQAQLLQATGLTAETAQNLEKSIVCYKNILSNTPDDFWEVEQNSSVLYLRISYNLALLCLHATRYLAISGTDTHEDILNYKAQALEYWNEAIDKAIYPADIAQIQCLKAEILCELGKSKRELRKAGKILDKVLEDQERATKNITLSGISSVEHKQLFFDLAKSHLVAFQLEGRKEKCNLEWMCDCATKAIDIYEKILGATHRQLIFAKLWKIVALLKLAAQKRKEIAICKNQIRKGELVECFESYHTEIVTMCNQMLKDLRDDKSIFSICAQKHTWLMITAVYVQKQHRDKADQCYQEIEALQKEIIQRNAITSLDDLMFQKMHEMHAVFEGDEM